MSNRLFDLVKHGCSTYTLHLLQLLWLHYGTLMLRRHLKVFVFQSVINLKLTRFITFGDS